MPIRSTAHIKDADHPPKALLRRVGRAIGDYEMIRPHDRVLLGVSGGKDSLSLLHILRSLQRRAPIAFDLGVVTVDPQIAGFDPSELPAYYQHDSNLIWHYETQPIVAQAQAHIKGDSFCSYCARAKRGIMYRVCRTHGYNVLALAQHLDDLAESLLMSLFHNGQLRTMKAHYLNRAGDIRIIRPLVYCRERQTEDYARRAALPIVADSCPACFRVPSQRAAMKALLAQQEAQHPTLFTSLLQAMRPLLTESLTDDDS
jgi:tRNA(Ile)-lysidine synthase TilS/MesJ